MLVYGMRNLHSANKCEYRDILTVVENFGQLALQVTDVGLEAVALPHFDGEVVIVPLGFQARDVLSEERLGYFLEVVEIMRRHGLEPNRGHAFQTGWKG